LTFSVGGSSNADPLVAVLSSLGPADSSCSCSILDSSGSTIFLLFDCAPGRRNFDLFMCDIRTTLLVLQWPSLFVGVAAEANLEIRAIARNHLLGVYGYTRVGDSHVKIWRAAHAWNITS
jgi:hypothetical protein